MCREGWASAIVGLFSLVGLPPTSGLCRQARRPAPRPSVAAEFLDREFGDRVAALRRSGRGGGEAWPRNCTIAQRWSTPVGPSRRARRGWATGRGGADAGADGVLIRSTALGIRPVRSEFSRQLHCLWRRRFHRRWSQGWLSRRCAIGSAVVAKTQHTGGEGGRPDAGRVRRDDSGWCPEAPPDSRIYEDELAVAIGRTCALRRWSEGLAFSRWLCSRREDSAHRRRGRPDLTPGRGESGWRHPRSRPSHAPMRTRSPSIGRTGTRPDDRQVPRVGGSGRPALVV